MKNKIALTLVALFIVFTMKSFATTKIITNHFELFNPDSVTVYLGDTIDFQIDSFHDAIEVNESTWDSTWAVSNGGFNVPFGGGIWVPNAGGVYYYVCELHAHDGMIGRIFVIDPNGIQSQKITPSIELTVAPNPVLDYCRLNYFIPESGIITLSLINQMGVRIKVLHAGRKSKGTYEMNISATDFQKEGMFFIQVDIDENKFSNCVKVIVR